MKAYSTFLVTSVPIYVPKNALNILYIYINRFYVMKYYKKFLVRGKGQLKGTWLTHAFRRQSNVISFVNSIKFNSVAICFRSYIRARSRNNRPVKHDTDQSRKIEHIFYYVGTKWLNMYTRLFSTQTDTECHIITHSKNINTLKKLTLHPTVNW